MGKGAKQMTETYTFRYFNADGSFSGIAVVGAILSATDNSRSPVVEFLGRLSCRPSLLESSSSGLLGETRRSREANVRFGSKADVQG
jgi:hypothetical protein